MEELNTSESDFISRSNEADTLIEQMMMKSVFQVPSDDTSVEKGGSNGDQLNSSVIGGNLNGNKSYQDTLLFRQLNEGPTRPYHHGTGCGDAPRQHPVHDMNHWKALPNQLSNENGTETVPNSDNGSSSTTVSTFSDDSNFNSNHGSISKQPQAHGYLLRNGGPPNVFDFNINTVKSYSNLPMTPQHNQHDPQNDAEVEFMFCESPYHSSAPTLQFPKFRNDQNQNYQERQQAYNTPISPYTSQNPHTPQGHDWSNMNLNQLSNGNSGEIISAKINPIFYSPPHAQQQSIAPGPGGMTNNGFPQNQANTSVIQQQYVNTGEPQQHGILNNGYQQRAGSTINGMQPQQSVIQQHPMSNGGMQPHIMNNNGTAQQQTQNNGTQQGSWTNGRANHSSYINLDMCNQAAASPAKHGNWYGHQPPSPFLRYDEMKNLTPTTPLYPQMNQQNLQNPQYPLASSLMPKNLQHVQAQQLNHQDSSNEQRPVWSTEQKEPDTRTFKPTSQRKIQGIKTPERYVILRRRTVPDQEEGSILYLLKVTPPSPETTVSGPKVGNPYYERIALDPEKAQKEINGLRLITKVQRARLMHYAKELEIYRTAMAVMTNNNPFKMNQVRMYKQIQENDTKTEPSEIPEADEDKETEPLSPQK